MLWAEYRRPTSSERVRGICQTADKKVLESAILEYSQRVQDKIVAGPRKGNPYNPTDQQLYSDLVKHLWGDLGFADDEQFQAQEE